MKREAERNLAAKLAEQEKNRTAQQALTVPAREHDRPDSAPPEVTTYRAVPDQGDSGADRGGQQQDRAARHGLDQPVLGGTDLRLRHPPGATEGADGHRVSAAVTAATAPPQNPETEAELVDELRRRGAVASRFISLAEPSLSRCRDTQTCISHHSRFYSIQGVAHDEPDQPQGHLGWDGWRGV